MKRDFLNRKSRDNNANGLWLFREFQHMPTSSIVKCVGGEWHPYPHPHHGAS